MSKLVLVADDEKDIAEIVSELLEGEGIRTIRAHDGREALAAAEHHHPDAVVMDIKMPVLDGLETIRRIRKNAALQKTPIVVVTATRVIRELQEEFQQLGVHCWLSKPFEPDELVAAVKVAVGL